MKTRSQTKRESTGEPIANNERPKRNRRENHASDESIRFGRKFTGLLNVVQGHRLKESGGGFETLRWSDPLLLRDQEIPFRKSLNRRTVSMCSADESRFVSHQLETERGKAGDALPLVLVIFDDRPFASHSIQSISADGPTGHYVCSVKRERGRTQSMPVNTGCYSAFELILPRHMSKESLALTINGLPKPEHAGVTLPSVVL